MTGIADHRGWSREPLEFARKYCLDRELRAHFESKRRQSPDRQHKAQIFLEIDGAGTRHVTLTATNRAGEVVAEARSAFRPFYLAYYDWRKVANSLRWITNTSVTTSPIEPWALLNPKLARDVALVHELTLKG